MKRDYGVVEAEAYCDDCGWLTNSYKNGQAIAAIHAKKHGHKVNGHVINSFTYDGRDETK
jgi:hypothetical protein